MKNHDVTAKWVVEYIEFSCFEAEDEEELKKKILSHDWVDLMDTSVQSHIKLLDYRIEDVEEIKDNN